MIPRLATLLALLSVLAGCGGGGDAPVPVNTVIASAVVGPAGGNVSVSDPASPLSGAGVSIPPGALARDTQITIRDVTGAGGLPTQILQFRFGPEGLVFAQPVFLKIPYSQGLLDLFGLADPGELLVAATDALGGVSLLDTVEVDLVNRTVTAKTTHFSTFAVDSMSAGSALTSGSIHRLFFQPRLLTTEVFVVQRYGKDAIVSGPDTGASLQAVGKGSRASFWQSSNNLILVHGMTSSAVAFIGPQDLLETLGPHFDNVLIYQYPSGYSVSENANWLVNEVLANADPARFRAVIIGHSMGGLVVRHAVEKSTADPARQALPNYDPSATASFDGLMTHLVTIGTPNRGASLVDLGAVILSGTPNLVDAALSIPGLHDLAPDTLALDLNTGFVQPAGVDYLLIAGKLCIQQLGCILTDGLVSVSSATGDPELSSAIRPPGGTIVFPPDSSSLFDYEHRKLHNEALVNGVGDAILQFLGVR